MDIYPKPEGYQGAEIQMGKTILDKNRDRVFS